MSEYEKLSDEELSTLVAEKVMAWHRETDYDYKPPQVNWVDAKGSFQEIVNCEGQLENLPTWNPASDIAAAMQVLGKARVYHITRSDLAKPNEEFEVMVGFEPLRHRSRLRTATVLNGSLPRAISLAALKAISTKGE